MSPEAKQIIVTGAAGFIGSHLVNRLYKLGLDFVGLDSFRPAQKLSLVEYRQDWIRKTTGIDIKRLNLCSSEDILKLEEIMSGKENTIFHLAAFPGVRESSIRSSEYFSNNIVGTSNLFRLSTKFKNTKVFFASSSSVYGEILQKTAMIESDAKIENLRSFYAQTKFQNEQDAITLSSLGDTKFTAMRFFTAYGPYGRTDMAYWTFAERLLNGLPLSVYGNDGGSRSYTFIDDVIDILIGLYKIEQKSNFEIYNIGNPKSHSALKMIENLASTLGVKEYTVLHVDRPREDVTKTHCDSKKIFNTIGHKEFTDLSNGMGIFADWFKKYYDEIQKSFR